MFQKYSFLIWFSSLPLHMCVSFSSQKQSRMRSKQSRPSTAEIGTIKLIHCILDIFISGQHFTFFAHSIWYGFLTLNYLLLFFLRLKIENLGEKEGMLSRQELDSLVKKKKKRKRQIQDTLRVWNSYHYIAEQQLIFTTVTQHYQKLKLHSVEWKTILVLTQG